MDGYIAQNTSLHSTHTVKSITVLFVAYLMTLSLSENIEFRIEQTGNKEVHRMWEKAVIMA